MSLKKLIPRPVRKLARAVIDRVPVTVEYRPLRSEWPGEKRRFEYQERYVKFDIKPTDRVLDIGSGNEPFPYATCLVDRFLDPTPHREGAIYRGGKPLVSADIHNLPFADQSFDFVYCAHILEHVDDPVKACAELMRVARRGYLETPTMSEDILFLWGKERHKWHVVSINRTLCFFEYSPRQLEGIRSTVWESLIMNRRYHPLQEAYFTNRDIFNVMFEWKTEFNVYVFWANGTIETLNRNGTPVDGSLS
jgi:SAM-dependent methyltransferase